MPTILTFDAEACYKALVEVLKQTMNELINEFAREASMGLSAEGKADVEVITASETDKTEYTDFHSASGAAEFISAKCKFYANALMESFGTGSFADTGPDSYWDSYVNSSLFNPVRPGKAITGRKRGSYVNIYGQKQSTWGGNAGVDIEGRSWINSKGERVTIEPQMPSYSIQNAEKWLIKNGATRVERRIETRLTQFFQNEAGKFFRNMEA